MTYAEANTILQGRNKDRKVLGNNTTLERRDNGTIAVHLHNTDVVTFYPDNRVSLTSGGFQTVTTKDRLNNYSGHRVYSVNGVWLVDGIPFHDGITFGPRGGKPENAANPKTVNKAKKSLDKKVRAYIQGYCQNALQNGLEAPGNGDCWACLFTADTISDLATTEPMGMDHLLSHMEEKYYVPSLLWKAIHTHGYKNPSFIWAMIQNDLKRNDTRMMNRELTAYFRKRKPTLLKIAA